MRQNEKNEGVTKDELASVAQWHNAVQAAVGKALGGKLDGTFVCVTNAAGFYYDIFESTYNKNSLTTLDMLLSYKDSVYSLSGSFSELYKNVLNNCVYDFSKKDQETINEEQTAAGTKVGDIITAYDHSELNDGSIASPTVADVIRRIKEVTGYNYYDFDKIAEERPDLGNLCNYISAYAKIARNAAKLQNAWAKAEDMVDVIVANIDTPCAENGAVKTMDGDWVCAWDNLPSTSQLFDSLKSETNQISISMCADSFSERESTVHIENTVDVVVPFAWWFGVVNHEHEYDLSKYSSEASSLNMQITFNGVTLVPVVPQAFDGTKYWYDEFVLNEIATKSGTDATGYQLNGQEFDPTKLFGENGTMKRLKTLVVATQPTITLTFTAFDEQQMSEAFDQKTVAKFDLLGGLIRVNHESEYSYSDYTYDEKSQSLTVTIAPPPIGSSGDISKQTAFILGGVAETYPTSNCLAELSAKPLVLTEEEENNCYVLYKEDDSNTASDEKGYVFAGICDKSENVILPEKHIAVPLSTTGVTRVYYSRGWQVANVLKSSNDKNKVASGTWATLLDKNEISIAACCTDGKFYQPHTNRCFSESCGGQYIVGGHVITGQTASEVLADGVVYLLPICQHHNSKCCGTGFGNGDGFYMKTKKSGYALQLKGYLKISEVQEIQKIIKQ